MEYIDGEDLASLLRRVGRLAGDRALEISREICAGIAAAHAAGVIHRDLKPSNIMLDGKGRVRITDFGLSILGEETRTINEIAGTPAYMAPEQLAGTGASEKSDLYALGLVLYEIFTGKRVFSGTTLPEIVRMRREMPITPPAQLVKDIDPAVEAIILQCLSIRPENRPQSALEVLSALSGGDPVKAALAAGQTPSPSAVAAAPVRGALSPMVAWSCFASMLVLIGIGLYYVPQITIIGRMRPRLPPEALTVKAEEAIRTLGNTAECVDTSSGFILHTSLNGAGILRSLCARSKDSQ